ncbi:hypothetical protein V1506DRAFT_509491 [Lipomyces tetrasporus]
MDPTKTEARNVKANSCASNFQAPKQKPGDALFDSQALLGVPFGDALEIVKQVVQRYPTAPKWGVTYDVGCALESSLTILGKELDKDFLVAVNKFHVYAHQFSCIERYWSKAAFLVRQLKTSSAIHRHQSLDAHIECTSSNMTRELGAALCDRLWRVTKTLNAATWDLEKLNVNKDDILVQIDTQKTYVTSRWKQRLPFLVQQVREVADNIEKLMIERNFELEQVHTRLWGLKNSFEEDAPQSRRKLQDMNGKQETSSLLHYFFKLDNFGLTLSDVPCLVNSRDMRQAIQLYLQIQALHQEISIIRAEVMRAIKWAMENLKGLIAYARQNEAGTRFEEVFVDKMWAGEQVARSFVGNLDSMSRISPWKKHVFPDHNFLEQHTT